MEQQARIDHLVAEARRADPDRYLCALFAPAERREPVLGLVLLNHELARVPGRVSQPMAGLIRYQWWREAIAEAAAGEPRGHPVVESLAVGLREGWLREETLQALVDAREPELEAGGVPTDLEAAEAHLAATEGGLQEAVLACLGAHDQNQRRAAGLAGTALGLAMLARDPRRPESAGLAATRASALVAEARRLAPRPARPLMAAFLPARLAEAYARQARRTPGGDPGLSAGRPPFAVLDLVLANTLRRF